MTFWWENIVEKNVEKLMKQQVRKWHESWEQNNNDIEWNASVKVKNKQITMLIEMQKEKEKVWCWKFM